MLRYFDPYAHLCPLARALGPSSGHHGEKDLQYGPVLYMRNRTDERQSKAFSSPAMSEYTLVKNRLAQSPENVRFDELCRTFRCVLDLGGTGAGSKEKKKSLIQNQLSLCKRVEMFTLIRLIIPDVKHHSLCLFHCLSTCSVCDHPSVPVLTLPLFQP